MEFQSEEISISVSNPEKYYGLQRTEATSTAFLESGRQANLKKKKMKFVSEFAIYGSGNQPKLHQGHKY